MFLTLRYTRQDCSNSKDILTVCTCMMYTILWVNIDAASPQLLLPFNSESLTGIDFLPFISSHQFNTTLATIFTPLVWIVIIFFGFCGFSFIWAAGVTHYKAPTRQYTHRDKIEKCRESIYVGLHTLCELLRKIFRCNLSGSGNISNWERKKEVTWSLMSPQISKCFLQHPYCILDSSTDSRPYIYSVFKFTHAADYCE